MDNRNGDLNKSLKRKSKKFLQMGFQKSVDRKQEKEFLKRFLQIQRVLVENRNRDLNKSCRKSSIRVKAHTLAALEEV